MSSTMVSKQSKFQLYMRIPMRVLTLVRDFYVQSLTGCGGHVAYGNSMGCPTPQIPTLPRSFSTNPAQSSLRTAEEELRDLIRIGSTRRGGATAKVADSELRRSKTTAGSGGRGRVAAVTRSQTVGFGRIDEDKAYDFEEEDEVGLLGGGGFRSTTARRIKVA